MKVRITKASVTVSRDGGKRARTGAHLWGMIRNQLNDSHQGENSHARTLTRPCKYAMTGMPFALRRMQRNAEDQMIIDQDYAVRNVVSLYNSGESVTFNRI